MKAQVPPPGQCEQVLQALSAIKRPSTAEEITDNINAQLRMGEKPFSERQVSQEMRNVGDCAQTLYWLKSRPRRQP